ncbi:alcohol oxidase [Teratosphaeria nubilosa]|uniref:Alcohol oxidase n=1 Tax=Teratosphaeria nubilosa TaxID=161662 RepID=A0A6G1L8T8_9PEZI|nr:alcohol oxidase [Teratosphaeria nubilosa]
MSSTVALPAADFVICGGGTAGLVLAARLSEIPSVSAAVIEAGGDHSHDINVLAPGLLTSLYGNPEYDWGYESVPQAYMNGTVVDYPEGKQLGGSSAINYLAWTHASPRNIDNWGYLGNENWSWAELEPYYRKSEHFSSQTRRQGPVHNAYPHEWTPLDQAWPLTYDRLGLGMITDERDGLALGGYDVQRNINLHNNTKSYAATAYLNPVLYRKNLKIYTNALVIILSAGAIGSGENFQDHWLMNVGFEVVSRTFPTDDLANETIYNASYTEYVANRTGPLSWVSLGGGFLENISTSVRSTQSNASQPDLQSVLTLRDPLREHLFSRGNTHIQSSNASVYPLIHPNIFSHPTDLEILSIIILTGTNAGRIVMKACLTQAGAGPAQCCRETPAASLMRGSEYGTKRLRAIDASTFPLIPRGNLQGCAYVVAEQAADFVKERWAALVQ